MPRQYTTKSGYSFLIRPSTPDDAPLVISVINVICAETIWFLTDQYVPTVQWERVLHEPTYYPDHLLLVAEAVEQVVGWCRVFPYEFGDKSRHVADLGVGVVKKWRDQGIGTALIERAIAWSRDKLFKKLTLSVFSTNQRALHVFEKTGFVRTGIRYQQAKIENEYVDEILMERFLSLPNMDKLLSEPSDVEARLTV